MKTDLYTKAVLTVIAVMLTVIAGKQIFNPSSVVIAQDKPAVLQFAVGPNGNFYFYEQKLAHVLVAGPDGKEKPAIDLR